MYGGSKFWVFAFISFTRLFIRLSKIVPLQQVHRFGMWKLPFVKEMVRLYTERPCSRMQCCLLRLFNVVLNLIINDIVFGLEETAVRLQHLLYAVQKKSEIPPT